MKVRLQVHAERDSVLSAAYRRRPMRFLAKSEEVRMVNVTKHPIRFQNSAGDTYELPTSGVVLDAEFVENSSETHKSGVQIVRVKLAPAAGAKEKLEELERQHPGELIVGSLIAAQAFPCRVVALVSVEGYERVAADLKRMRDDKFTAFGPILTMGQGDIPFTYKQ